MVELQKIKEVIEQLRELKTSAEIRSEEQNNVTAGGRALGYERAIKLLTPLTVGEITDVDAGKNLSKVSSETDYLLTTLQGEVVGNVYLRRRS